MLTNIQLSASLDAIEGRIGEAVVARDDWESATGHEDWLESSATWYIETCFVQLMTLSESLALPLLRADISAEYRQAKDDGLFRQEEDPNGEKFLKWTAPLRKYVEAIRTIFALETERVVTKEVEDVLRASAYSITDLSVFGTVPCSERDVHIRMECILRPLFPDLLHQPAIAKPIKNFKPDTGLPLIKTLIEYKFISSPEMVPIIADELLADVGGYHCPEWTSFIYVIYETARFKHEVEWKNLLRQSRADGRTTVVVIAGEPPLAGRSKRSPGKSYLKGKKVAQGRGRA